MLQHGVQLLDRFCQDDRIRIRQPQRNLQIKFERLLDGKKNDFVAYVDAIGKLDGTRCLIEWKTTSARYPEEPENRCDQSHHEKCKCPTQHTVS